jgi:hypothetical protein
MNAAMMTLSLLVSILMVESAESRIRDPSSTSSSRSNVATATGLEGTGLRGASSGSNESNGRLYRNEQSGRIQTFTSYLELFNERYSNARLHQGSSGEAEHAHHLASLGMTYQLQQYLDNQGHQLLHSRDNDGWTLLHDAVFHNQVSVVKYLLSLDEVLRPSSSIKAVPDLQVDDLLNGMNFQGQTPLDMALDMAHDHGDFTDDQNQIIQLLVVCGATLPPMFMADDTNDEKIAINYIHQNAKEDYPVSIDRHR